MMAAAAATATGVALNRLGSSSHGRGHNGSGGDGGDGVGGVGGVRGEAESTARLLPACSHVPLARSRSRSPSGPQKNSTASTTISTTHTRQHAPPLSRIATSPLMMESMSLARSSPCLALPRLACLFGSPTPCSNWRLCPSRHATWHRSRRRIPPRTQRASRRP